MAWTSEGGNFEQPKPGPHVARFYKIVELGTQTDTYEGKTKKNKKCIIWWELATLMADGQPFSIFKEYTQSLSEKATLRKHLESWAGKVMTEEQHTNFDPRKLLGKACMLSLVLTSRQKVKVDSIMQVMPGMPKPPQVNPSTYFSMEAFDFDAFQALPTWVREKIESSPEFQALGLSEQKTGDAEGDGPGHGEVAPDDIPF